MGALPRGRGPAAVLAVGSHAVWPLSERTLWQRLPAAVQAHISLEDQASASDSAPSSVDAVLLHADAETTLQIMRAWAERPGAIVPLTTLKPGEQNIPLERLVTERSISTNTAAAGCAATNSVMCANAAPFGPIAGSITKASRRVGLSQPSISQQLAKLEERLGTKLLHRTTRRLSLTEAGQQYLSRVRNILQDIQEADAAASSQTTELAGLLRLHAPPGIDIDRVALKPAFLAFGAGIVAERRGGQQGPHAQRRRKDVHKAAGRDAQARADRARQGVARRLHRERGHSPRQLLSREVCGA